MAAVLFLIGFPLFIAVLALVLPRGLLVKKLIGVAAAIALSAVPIYLLVTHLDRGGEYFRLDSPFIEIGMFLAELGIAGYLVYLSIRAKRYRDATGPDFSHTFIGMVETYGRAYEFGLATRHYLRHFPLRLPALAPMGMGLLSRHRMTMKPKRIRGLKELQAILERAKQLEATP